VEPDLLGRLHVVEHRHPPGPDEGQPPHLVRVEPRQVHVGKDALGEPQRQEHDVLALGLHVGGALRRDLLGPGVEQVRHHAHVVGSEAPQRALVAADAAEVRALRVQVVDRAEGAAPHEPVQVPDGGVMEQQVPTASTRCAFPRGRSGFRDGASG
jgi:hypothetical protein